jgi:hypothetical protein
MKAAVLVLMIGLSGCAAKKPAIAHQAFWTECNEVAIDARSHAQIFICRDVHGRGWKVEVTPEGK